MNYAAWRASGERVRIGEREIFVRASGAGEPLLFLHGFPTTSYDYDEIVAALGRRFRCIAFDFAGFGDSDVPATYSLQHQADVTLGVARHFGLERTVIVTHDYGVSVAEELLARKGEGLAIDGIVFMNGGVEPALHRPILVQRLLASPLGALVGPFLVSRTTFVRAMHRILARPERMDIEQHWMAISSRGSHRRTHELLGYIAERKLYRERWTSAFADRRTPVALAWGERDPISGAHMLEWARVTRPDAKVLALDVGHYPQIESPNEVAEFIASFAARRPS